MPKIDPVTGCTVMTTGEFWAKEAESEGEGRSGGELFGEFIDELQAEMDKEEARLRQPHVALSELRRIVKDERRRVAKEIRSDQARGREPYPEDIQLAQFPMPMRIVEVLEVECRQNFRSSSTKIKARAIRMEKGREVEDTIEFSADHYSGTMMDPPEYDESLSWEGLP